MTSVFTVFLFLAIASSTARVSAATRITMNLIHRDSILSPTAATWFASSSVAFDSDYQVHMRANLIQSSLFIYYVNFSIGTPPVPQLAAMATGSSLSWVKCLPCQPCSSQTGLFDPTKSSTYAPKQCDTDCDTCNDEFDQCEFNHSYAGGPPFEGTLATESLHFATPHEGYGTIEGVPFGCYRKTRDLLEESAAMTGVMGLGAGPDSLLWRIESHHPKFSYCIGDAQNPAYNFSRLEIGEGAILGGVWTPYVTEFGHYYVTVERMSFDGATLDIRSSAFTKTPTVDNGVILNTGATVTFLKREAYDVVERTIESYLQGSLWTRVWPELGVGSVCYGGKVRDVAEAGFPILGIHFAGGAELSMDAFGSLVQLDEDSFCLAFNVADPTESSSIGILAQQNYNVGYDLVHRRVYFERRDCQDFS